MNNDFIQRYKKELKNSQFWDFNKKIGVIFAVLLLAVIMFNTSGCSQQELDEEIGINSPVEEELQKDTVKVGNDGVNAAIAPDDDVSIVSQQKAINTDNMVTMSIEDVGRADPFLPEFEKVQTNNTQSRPRASYNLLPPPETITVDTTATEVMTTKVSGIMYDRMNPSAILNISGSDYLVRTGDVINNYKVLSIAKENVTVQYGANIYKAGVGEIFTGEGVNFNTISNLESKFGGRNNKANK